MAKKKNTPLPSFMNAGNSWYNEMKTWEKDREVRVEQSKAWDAAGDKAPYAGRITPTYNDEKFNEKEGTLANKSSKWRTKSVEGLSSKRYGKKYNDRLHKLMDEAGIPKSERYEFAKWMDANEQKIESNVVQGYTARPVTEKEAFMASKGPQLNMALPDVGKRNIAQTVEKLQHENRNIAEKAIHSVKNIDGGKVLDGLLKGGKEVSRFLNNVSNLGMPMFESMDKKLAESTFKRTGDDTLLNRYEQMYGDEGRGTAGKVADFAGEGLGMLATGAGIAGGVRGLTTKMGLKAPATMKGAAARLAGEGAAVGAIDQSARALQNQTIAKDLEQNQNRTWKDETRDIAIATGAGAVLDPLISLAAPLAKAGMRRSANNAVDTTLRQQADVLEELSRTVPRMADVEVAGRNISSSVRSPLESQQNASRNILEGLADPALNQRNLAQTLRNPAIPKVDDQKSSQMRIWEHFDRPVSTANEGSTVPNSQTTTPEPEMPPTTEPELDLGPRGGSSADSLVLDMDPDYSRMSAELDDLYQQRQAIPVDDHVRDDEILERIQQAEAALEQRRTAVLAQYETPAGPEPSINSSPQPPAGEPDDIMSLLRNTPITPEAMETASASTKFPASVPKPKPPTEEVNPLDALLRDVQEAGARAEGTPKGPSREQPVDLENHSPIHYADPDAPKVKEKKDSFFTDAYRKMVSATGEFRKIDDFFHNLQKQRLAEGLPDNVDVDNLLKTTPDGSLATDSSVRKGLRSMTRIDAKSVHFMKSNYEGVMQKIEKYGVDERAFNEYSLAMHARDIFQKNGDDLAARHSLEQQFDELLGAGGADLKELNKLQDEIADLNPYRMHEDVTPQWAETIIRQFEADPKLNEVYNDFMAAQKRTLEYARDNGTLSNEAFELLQKEHPHYVSLARHVEPSTSRGNGPGSGNTGIGTRGDGSESLKHLPPLETALKNAYVIAANAERNKALQPIAKMAGMDDLGEFFTKRSAPSNKTVAIHVNGKPQYYEVPDHMLWYINNGTKAPNHGAFGKGVALPANVFRKATTHYNPSFHLVSAVRDTQQAVFQSRTGNPLTMAMDVPLGFVDSFAGELLERVTKGKFKSFKPFYEAQGGGHTHFITTDQEAMAKSAKAIQDGTFGKSNTGGKVKSIIMSPFKGLEKFGNAIERGPKLAEMRSATRKGYSPDDAMYEAVDVMDYSDMGQWTRQINPYIPYLGATMRGNARIMKSFTEGGVKGAAKQLGRGAAMFTLPTLGIYALREADYVTEDQRNELRNMQDWQKNLYWHIPRSDGETILSIHKPHVLGQLFANPLERALEQADELTMKTDGQAARQVMKDLLFSFIPPSEMAGISTGWDLSRNQDGFTKFEIESQYDIDAGVPVRDRESYEQSNVTRGLANLLNAGQEEGWASPAKVDFAVKDLTGTMGKQALTGLDDLIRQFDPQGKHSNAGVRDSMDELLKPVTQFKADPIRASGVPNALKRVAADEKKGNKDKSKMSDAEKEIENARRPAQNYQKEIKEINKQIQAIRDNEKLTSDEKRSRIEELRKEQDELGSDVINWWNRTN